MSNRYVIAGLKVQMEPKFELLKTRSEKYRFDFEGPADIILKISEERFQFARERHHGTSDEVIEYMSTGSMFYFGLLQFGGFLLHSSCISYNNKAYFFTADSGTGKSTHTSLWQKYIDNVIMINDDKPAVRLIDGQFYAIGTPWSGKTAQNADVTVAVGGVALLYRSKTNSIRTALPNESVPFFMKQTILPYQSENTDRLAELMDNFLRTVPVYHLECDMSEHAVKTSFEAMTNERYIAKGNKNG